MRALKYILFFLLTTNLILGQDTLPSDEKLNEALWEKEASKYEYLDHSFKFSNKSSEKENTGLDFNGQYILYAIIFIVLAVVLFLLIKYTKIRKAPTKKSILFTDNYEQKLLDIDVDNLLNKAITLEDHKQAIRFSFLKLLKTLALKEIIIWRKEYTTGQYGHQLREQIFYTDFQVARMIYERKWFNNEVSSKKDFEAYTSLIDVLNSKV